jgi:REase_MTES_1575
MDPADIAQLLADQEALPPLLSRLALEAAKDIVASGAFVDAPKYIESVMDVLASKHCRLVFQHAASPIELIWINSLQVQFLRNSSPLVTTAPVANFPDFIRSFPGMLRNVDTFLRGYKGNISRLDEYFDAQVKAKRLPANSRNAAYEQVMEYGVMPFREAFRITLQAGFPKAGPKGKSMRIDALLWHPEVPQLRVAIELDGYEFHSSKDSFTQDRQRDRALQALGVQVFRFSGAEIYKHPADAVADLYDFLWDSKGRLTAPGPPDSPSTVMNG